MSPNCEICGSPLDGRGEVPGYQAPRSYRILECTACRTMVSDPKRLEPKVYDAIYSVPGGPPGYDRNFQYARGVRRVEDPLKYLTSRQDAFWGVEQLLRPFVKPRILEVGCGLGYFTYALRHSGYNATGIDVSPEAVAKAKRAFGDFYLAESIESYAARGGEKFDVIIMVEVIEHLEQPIPVLEAALRLLNPAGCVLSVDAESDIFRSGCVVGNRPTPSTPVVVFRTVCSSHRAPTWL